jgi:hypothetical protein
VIFDSKITIMSTDATLSPNYDDPSLLVTNYDAAPSQALNYDNDATTVIAAASYEASYPVADDGNNESSYLARNIEGAYEASETDVSKVQWNDLHEDENGITIGVYGCLWDEFTSKQLRTICTRLSVKGYKNAKKSDMVDKIQQSFHNKKVYNGLQNRTRSTVQNSVKKEVQCAFRLMNILFSDEFVSNFACLGDVASRITLDTGKAANDELFWVGVQRAFTEEENCDEYNLLKFIDDPVFAVQGHIDPGKIVCHDWKKLRTIWKSINSEYKGALTRFTMSGTHNNDFYCFCNGRLDTYYLRKNLEIRPEVNGMVEADLPEQCALSSDMSGLELLRVMGSMPTEIDGQRRASPTSLDGDSSKNSGSQKRKRSPSDIITAIKEMGSSQIKSDLAHEKIRFLEMENTRRQNEENRRSEEFSQLRTKAQLEEWEKIQANIRIVRQDLRGEMIDETEKADLLDDLSGLLSRKKELAIALGFHK